MANNIVCYTAKKLTQIERNFLHRKLHGYTEFSNMGRYKYKREGFLEKKGKKIIDGVILLEEKDTKELLQILKEAKAKYHIFRILKKLSR